MITLYNVIDIRTNSYYSIAIVSKSKVKYFISSDKIEDINYLS